MTTTLAPASNNGGAPNGDAAPVAALPFLRGAYEYGEGAFLDVSNTLGTSTIAITDKEVPSFGYARNIVLHVTGTGSSGGTSAFDEDGPWNVLKDITFKDVNGRQIVGPINGYELYLINKWGGYTGKGFDPALAPEYSALTSNGTFEFMLRIPLEISARDGIGVLPNQNTAAQYTIGMTQGVTGDVYDTAPSTTLPTVRIRAYLEAYTPPVPTDPAGLPIAPQPPALGTTQMWTRQTPSIASGDQRVEQTRRGNLLRNVLFIARDSSGRDTAEFPESIRIELDGKTLVNLSRDVLRRYMWERSGMQPDTGVLLWDFTHDLDNSLGQESRHLYLPTTSATRLEYLGSFGAGITSLTVLTNDVAIAAG